MKNGGLVSINGAASGQGVYERQQAEGSQEKRRESCPRIRQKRSRLNRMEDFHA